MITQSSVSKTEDLHGCAIPFAGKHCVFQCGESWYSVPAVSVREIVRTPALTYVPHSHEALAGLCHLRSDFIPVISLEKLLDVGSPSTSQRNGCLLVFDDRCLWACLVSESTGLETVETIVSQENPDEVLASPIIGTAMTGGRIVRVLNPTTLLARAQHTLDAFWNSSAADSQRSVLEAK